MRQNFAFRRSSRVVHEVGIFARSIRNKTLQSLVRDVLAFSEHTYRSFLKICATAMDAQICLLVFCLVFAIGELNAQLSHKGGNCPLQMTVTRCTPSCVSDHQCNFNQKCCHNKCGNMSCASPSSVPTGTGHSETRDVYCAGMKCGPYEKCQFDRSTKREKCVRT